MKADPEFRSRPGRYFYHRRNGPCRGIDGTGVACRDLGDAVTQAYVEMLDWMESSPRSRILPRLVEVTDEGGRTVFRLPSSAVVSNISG